MAAPDSRLVRACRAMPVDRTPVWLMRQAGRYMPEYRALRKQHSLIEICKNPNLAAEITILAAEILKVDAAIIFADLLLPLEVMGLPFYFSSSEGPVIKEPVRDRADVARLRTDAAAELGYVAEAVRLVAKHFATTLPVIGFCGAPFTLASYMIEGGGSRQYINTKKLMYLEPEAFDELLHKLVGVTAAYAQEQVRAGADVIQVFDSWVGCLSVQDYRRYVLPQTTNLVEEIRTTGAPVIYFGTDTSTLLSSMKETGAEVIGLDWRIPLDEGWARIGNCGAVQGNLDPVTLFSEWEQIEVSAREILDRAAGRPGHIFNLGHGILPETPVENVKALVDYVQQHSDLSTAATSVVSNISEPKTAVLLLAHGSPDSPDDVPEFLGKVTGGRPLSPEVIDEVKRRYQAIGRSPLTEITLKQGELLAARLQTPVYVGMRNWHPFISQALRRMVKDGIHHAVVICMAPQNSRTSVGLYRTSLRSCRDPELTFDFVESWHDQPFLIQAFVERLKTGRKKVRKEARKNPAVIFTAHSVPQRTILEGDPYEVQAKRTAELVANGACLNRSEWRLAFQSQGLSGGAWLGPTVEATILDLARSNFPSIFIQPIGFLCDHVEVLYDIDIGFKQFAERQGLRLWRAESLNDSPLLTAALAEIATARFGSWREVPGV